MAQPQKKVFLWAVPRSISTAFFRAMMNRKSIAVHLEPYSRAYYYGPDRISKRYESEPIHPEDTFENVKALCEKDRPDCESIFVKDMAYYLVTRLDTRDFIPDGYVHTFMLRDPKKSVYSLYKMSLNKELTGWDHFDASEVGFKELYQMFEHVTKGLGQEAIVVDADELLAHPEGILRQYCNKVGLPFEDNMLNWDDCPREMELFKDWMPWFEGVLTSKSFKPSATKPKSPLVLPQLPKHVQKAIDENTVFYNKMYEHRIRPTVGDTLKV